MELIALLREAAPLMLTGAGYTLLFALASMVGGLALGFPVALMRISPLALLRYPASLYVSVMRARRCWCRSSSSITACPPSAST